MNLTQEALRNIVFRGYSGSKAYGTNTQDSDEDIRGLFVPYKKSILTPFYNCEQATGAGEDEIYYSIFKFMKLYTDGNPNILELLWIDESDVIQDSPSYQALRDVRSALLSRKVKHTFTSYAHAQLLRIRGHNRWLNNPQPARQPQQLDFVDIVYDYESEQVFTHAKALNQYPSLLTPGHLIHEESGLLFLFDTDNKYRNPVADSGNLIIHTGDLPDDMAGARPLVQLRFREPHFKQTLNDWNNYWSWVKNRNDTRAELERDYGFDTKHAMHCIRLLRMGKEILEGRGVLVKRPDAEELLSIRHGAWTYERVLDEAKSLEKACEQLYEVSKLPKTPPIGLAADVLVEVLEAYWDK